MVVAADPSAAATSILPSTFSALKMLTTFIGKRRPPTRDHLDAALSSWIQTSQSGKTHRVATIALVHGGGGSAWDWHLVEPALRELGHESVAVDLPCDDQTAGWSEYVD